MSETPELVEADRKIRWLVGQLESQAHQNRKVGYKAIADLCQQSSEALTALQEKIRRLEAALNPFAQLADAFERAQPNLDDDFLCSSRMSDLRKARTALNGSPDQ